MNCILFSLAPVYVTPLAWVPMFLQCGFFQRVHNYHSSLSNDSDTLTFYCSCSTLLKIEKWSSFDYRIVTTKRTVHLNPQLQLRKEQRFSCLHHPWHLMISHQLYHLSVRMCHQMLPLLSWTGLNLKAVMRMMTPTPRGHLPVLVKVWLNIHFISFSNWDIISKLIKCCQKNLISFILTHSQFYHVPYSSIFCKNLNSF